MVIVKTSERYETPVCPADVHGRPKFHCIVEATLRYPSELVCFSQKSSHLVRG